NVFYVNYKEKNIPFMDYLVSFCYLESTVWSLTLIFIKGKKQNINQSSAFHCYRILTVLERL
ncbi:hypothetical protein, partial [Priestia megaterium]|uniref:hypothetical protein n=1 Tax=Priestia megaterium TaxID=1404 RepID=UPI0030006E0F